MDMARLVKERGPLSVAQAARLGSGGWALQCLEVWVVIATSSRESAAQSEGCVKVMDLGLARSATDLPQDQDGAVPPLPRSRRRRRVGDDRLHAPEQLWDSGRVDRPCLICTAWVTLYFLLTGVRVRQRLEGISRNGKRNLSKRARNSPRLAGVPLGVAVILENGCAKNPAYRL